MNKKNFATIGVAIALTLLFIATTQYPGGSQHDDMSVGFSWQHNYLSNLLNPIAVNGQENAARPWAVAGMLFLCAAMALSFFQFSKKIPVKGAANSIVRYAGIGAMVAAVFTGTPFHDLAVRVSGTLLMVSLFYITVFILKSKLNGLKVLAAAGMLLLYGTSFIYYSSTYLEILPVMQKLLLITVVIWLLSLEYFTNRADFELASS